jgi:hypothetical protein
VTVREEMRGSEEKGQLEKSDWMKRDGNDRGKDGTKRKEGEEE